MLCYRPWNVSRGRGRRGPGRDRRARRGKFGWEVTRGSLEYATHSAEEARSTAHRSLPPLEGAGHHPGGEERHSRHAARRGDRAGWRGRRQCKPLVGADEALALGQAQGGHLAQRLDELLHRAARAASATPRQDTEDKRRQKAGVGMRVAGAALVRVAALPHCTYYASRRRRRCASTVRSRGRKIDR